MPLRKETVEEELWHLFHSVAKVMPEKDGYLIRIPFYDFAGDPIELFIYERGGQYIVEDAGSVSGRMFAMGQDATDTPAFQLLMSLAKAYGIQVDLNTGIMRLTSPNLSEILHDMIKVVLSLITALPHMRIIPRRSASISFGET